VFLAPVSLVPGQRWPQEILNALEPSTWVLFLASRTAHLHGYNKISARCSPNKRSSFQPCGTYRRRSFLAGQASKPTPVNVYLRYDGEAAIRVRGFYYVTVSPSLVDTYSNPDARGEIEDTALTAFQGHMDNMTASVLSIPNRDLVTTLWHGPLTKAEADGLSDGSHAALLFMGIFKWEERGRTHQVNYCASARGYPAVIKLCRNHNGPMKINSAAG
jgi:hypothetical protein